jgi:hypothetical protein
MYLVGASGRLRRVVRNAVKKAVLRSAEYLGYYNIAKRRRKGATVLCYHGVEENIYDNRVQYLQTPLRVFEQQIQYLRTNFEIISVDYLYDCLKHDYKLHPSQLVITFDDGYKNNFEIATPFLRGYDIPFTVFVSTSNVCNGTRFPAYYVHAGIFYTSKDFFECKSINRKYDISTPEKRSLANGDLLKRMKTSSQEQVAALVEELARLLPPDRWDEVNGIFCSEEPLNWSAATTMKTW